MVQQYQSFHMLPEKIHKKDLKTISVDQHGNDNYYTELLCMFLLYLQIPCRLYGAFLKESLQDHSLQVFFQGQVVLGRPILQLVLHEKDNI